MAKWWLLVGFGGLLLVLSCITWLWWDDAVLYLLTSVRPYLQFLFAARDLGGEFRREIALGYTVIMAMMFMFGVGIVALRDRYSHRAMLISSLTVTGLATVAYSWLSSDIYSYLFAAKMVLVYGANPYEVVPKVFADQDLWLGFVRWTENTYAYGPIALVHNLGLMFVGGTQRLLLNMLLWKVMVGGMFWLTGWLILKSTDSKLWAMSWWFNPWLLHELVINAHNDVVMLFWWWIAVWLFSFGKGWLGTGAWALSVFTKYVSGPLILGMFLNKEFQQFFYKLCVFGLLFYFAFVVRHSWYYTWLYMMYPLTVWKSWSYWLLRSMELVIVISYYFSFIMTGFWIPHILSGWTYWIVVLIPAVVLVLEVWYPAQVGWRHWRLVHGALAVNKQAEMES